MEYIINKMYSSLLELTQNNSAIVVPYFRRSGGRTSLGEHIKMCTFDEIILEIFLTDESLFLTGKLREKASRITFFSHFAFQ